MAAGMLKMTLMMAFRFNRMNTTVSRSQGTHEVMSSEINLTGRMLASRSGKGGRERAGTNLRADHGEKQAVSVQEVEHLRRTRVSGAQAVAMGRRRRLTAG